MFKTAWFYVVMLPLVLFVGLVNKYASLSLSELMFCFGLCAAICARVVDTSLLEWKVLVTMLGASLVGMLVLQSWQSGKLFSEFLFWWGVFGIPLRATLRPISERKR